MCIDDGCKLGAVLPCAIPKAASRLRAKQRGSNFAESVQQRWCRKMAGFAETFTVMQKENYSERKTDLASDAEPHAENGADADDLQIRVQCAVRRAAPCADTCTELRADGCAVIRAEPFADTRAVVGAEPRAVFRADGCVEKMAPMQKWIAETGRADD